MGVKFTMYIFSWIQNLRAGEENIVLTTIQTVLLITLLCELSCPLVSVETLLYTFLTFYIRVKDAIYSSHQQSRYLWMRPKQKTQQKIFNAVRHLNFISIG